MPRPIEKVLSELPEDSPFRKALTVLVSPDPKMRRTALTALRPLMRPYWEPPVVFDEAHALAVLRAVFDLSFPPSEDRYERGVDDVLFALIGSAHPPLLELIEARFADVDPNLRLTLLTLVASAGTRRGAELFVTLVSRHGWPPSFHARFTTELGKNLEHAEVLFPALLEVPGGPSIDLSDLMLSALRTQRLAPQALSASPIATGLTERIRALLARTAALRGKPEPTDAEANVPNELAVALDLAGFLGESDVLPLLREATELPERRVAAFALTSLARRGEPLEEAALTRVASSHEGLPTLYGLLRDLGKEQQIPAALRTRDAFAAADLSRWLSHPGELGRPPDELEAMAVFAGREAGHDVTLHVFRFRVRDGAWNAGVAGPYHLDAPEGPLFGSSTFSRFEPWTKHDARGHAHAIAENLAEWREAWAKEGR